MSVLRLPRLIFSGKFQADPSTVNNDPAHFDSLNFKPEYQLPETQTAPNGWWNPKGTGNWQFSQCVVTRVVYRDGTTCDDPQVDPIVGTSILSNPAGTSARIVDLDSQNQLVSSIWGLTVVAGQPGAFGFSGRFAVAAFQDLGTRATAAGAGDFPAGAGWQSVLSPVQWIGAAQSRYLTELAEGGPPSTLSMKFNVDGYNMTSSSTEFTFGRVVGAIAPYLEGEPRRFVAARALDPVAGGSLANSAYAEIVDHRLTIDLGNSLPTVAPGGVLVDLGALDLAIVTGAGPKIIGPIPYLSAGFYEKSAGIVSFTLTDDQLQAAQSNPLAIVSHGSNLAQLREASDGIWVRADDTVFRLNPGDPATTEFRATRFGKPAAGVTIRLGFDPTLLLQQQNQGPIPGPAVVGQPTSALSFSSSITTGPDGSATLTITASDPGNPRQYIDGQVYVLTYGPGAAPPAVGQVQEPSRLLHLLVWSSYTPPATPTWTHDVQPILIQYANLYPVMKDYVDLSSFDDVSSKAILIKQVFSLGPDRPEYMPVTRDLSAKKSAMIIQWCDNPVE